MNRTPNDMGAKAVDPEMAVVVVCYGPREQLLPSVSSIARQTGVHVNRLILVDNNPSDSPCETSDLHAILHSKIQLDILRPGENLGYGRAINLAASLSREEFLLVANPDLLLEDHTLEKLLRSIEATPRAAAAGPSLLGLDGLPPRTPTERLPNLRSDLLGLSGLVQLMRLRPNQSNSNTGVQEPATHPVDFLSGACFLIRREAFNCVDGFDPNFFLYYEDADLSRRLRSVGWQLLKVPDARALHAHGGSWTDPVRRQLEGFRGAWTYHRKHAGPLAAFLFRLALLFLYIPRLYIGGLKNVRTSFNKKQRRRLIRETARFVWKPRTIAPTKKLGVAP